MSETKWNSACPYKGCPGEADVPSGTFDGSVVCCWKCRRECVVVVAAEDDADPGWWLERSE